MELVALTVVADFAVVGVVVAGVVVADFAVVGVVVAGVVVTGVVEAVLPLAAGVEVEVLAAACWFSRLVRLL
ncbi:MAG: hypothetical protein M0Z30_06420, partial [Actinomycetota bacterium]|nr:hypothetical protein [Actinomycetota bacterium]